jgi:serine phosphatase RsbU (regulator of sigma subunit)/PAS domain-containing protein
VTVPEGADPASLVVDLDDPRRLAAVRRVLLPGPRSQGLDRLTALAANLLHAPYAQVSLIGDRQVVLGLCGTDVPEAEWGGPREDSLCTVTVAGSGPLVVSDAAEDPRVSGLPPVTGGLVGSYLGVPLATSEGHVLGSLCVYDGEARMWSPEQVGILGELATSVVAELELRAITLEVATSAARLELALSAADIGSFDWNLETDELQWDDRLIAVFGYDKEGFQPHFDSFRDRVHPDDLPELLAAIERAKETGDYASDYRIVLPGGEIRHVEARGRTLRGPGGRAVRMLGAAFDATERLEAQRERESAYREREQAVVERERAYAAAEAANTRLALLADATTRLSASLEPRQVLETLAHIVVPSLGAWMAVVMPEEAAAPLLPDEPTGDARRLQVVHVAHGDRSRTDALGALLRSVTLSVDDPHGPGAVARTREPEWLPLVTDDVVDSFTTDDEELRTALHELSVGAALTLPLLSRGRCLGALTVAEPVSGPVDGALLVDLAARAAVAFDNALLYGTERRTGITLQRSLLPREIARPAGVDVAVRYLPGASGAFIGGDWYQGVPVGGGLLLAMGDVMGHGMRSAARMGQLRAIVATLALEGHGPGELLLRLATHCDVLLDLELATLLVAHYDPQERRLVVASAGHPPPLLAPLDRDPEYLEVEPGPPLGTLVGSYEEVTVDVPSGATLVLFTDGLVENREEPLTAGLERLRAALREVKLPAEAVADHVLRALDREHGGSDDVALLVLNHAAPADPGTG